VVSYFYNLQRNEGIILLYPSPPGQFPLEMNYLDWKILSQDRGFLPPDSFFICVLMPAPETPLGFRIKLPYV